MDIAATQNHELSSPAARIGNDSDGAQAAFAPERPLYPELPSITAILRLLGDTTRLRLLFLLVAGERSVTALYTELGISQPVASHHLAWLRASRLVVFRRHGKRVYYALGPAVHPEGGWLTIGSLRFRLGGDA